MNKKIAAGGCFLAVFMGFFLQGCDMFQEEKKLRDVEYTVMSVEDVPEELAQKIEKEREKEFQLSYDDGEYLYIARGYGQRNTSGYNIGVEQIYITEHSLVVDTKISGPMEGEEVVETKTTPFIVIKMEPMERQIVFR